MRKLLKNKKVQGILQLLLSLALLSYLLWVVGPEEVAFILRQIHWTWYFPAFLLFLLNIIIRAYRWYILLHALNNRPSLSHLTYLYFIGFFANNFIPSGFGGDVVKVISLRQTFGRGAEALSSVMMERITGLVGSSFIALVALIWNAISHTTNIDLPLAIWLVVLAFSFGVPILFILARWGRLLEQLEARWPRITHLPKYDKVQQLEETIRRYPLTALLHSLFISLPFTLSLISVQYSIARALSVHVPLAAFGLFVPIIALVNLLPFSFNGLGVRETAYLLLFGAISVPDESAIAMSLAFYFLRFGGGLVGGLLYAGRSVWQLMQSPQARNL